LTFGDPLPDKRLVLHMTVEGECNLEMAFEHKCGDFKKSPTACLMAKVGRSARFTGLASHSTQWLKESVGPFELLFGKLEIYVLDRALVAYLILAEVIEQDLHRPMCLELFLAIFGETSPSEIWSTIARNSAFKILDFADSIRGIL
jgi:hypothetical protein